MSNLSIYEAVRTVPTNALKQIQAGRLKGKSDINPMWRIKALTEQFGPCGIGWKYTITEKRLEEGANSEIAAFVDINLYIKVNGEWSEPIPGTGGSAFVANEKNGLYVSDECFKMALTNAISVSCKALGFAADVYWDKDSTKYSKPLQAAQDAPGTQVKDDKANMRSEIKKMLWAMSGHDPEEAIALLEHFTSFEGKNGKVAGKTDVAKIGDKQLPITYDKIKKAFAEWKKTHE